MSRLSLKTKITVIIPLGVALLIVVAAIVIDVRLVSGLRVAQVHGADSHNSDVAMQITQTRRVLWSGMLALLLCSAAGMHILTRRSLQPVLELAAQTKRLREEICSGRLDVGVDLETGELAQSINAMLEELELRQQELRKHASFLLTLIDAIPIPVFYLNGTGRYIGCNQAFEQAMGLKRAELIGKTVHDVVPPQRAAVYEYGDRELLRTGGVQQYDESVMYADGTVHEVMFSKATFNNEDGTVGGLLGTYLDMTERKEGEKALERQKAFTENLLENASVAIFVIDKQHQVIIWNHACEELTGLPATGIIKTDGHWQGFYHEQRPCLADLVLDKQTDINTTYYEVCRKSPTNPEGMQAEGWYTLAGRRRYVLFTAAPIRSADGTIVAAIETLEDITYRKEQEDELAAVARAVSIAGGEGFFAAVAHYIAKTLGTDYVIIGGMNEHNPLQVNTLAVAFQDGFAPNFTYQLSESPCSSIMNGSICCYPENVRTIYPHDQLLQEKGIEGYIGVSLLGTGRVPLGILVAMNRTAIQNPERARSLLKIFAARTSAELQRKIDEDRLRKLSYAVAQSPVSVLITDTQGRIEFVNPKFTRVTGYTADEIVGKTPAILKSGETSPDVYRTLWQAIEHGREWEGIFHNRRKDGELYWERAYIGPIKDENGVITNFIGIKEDITEHKKLEGALRHAQKMEAVGQLAGGVAHDFNNVLTAVIGYASILDIHAGDDLHLSNGVQQIIKAAERGANLTKSLLSFSRRQAANKQVVDLNEVVVRSEKLLQHLISETVALKISLDSSPLTVNVDIVEIEQVLMNLVTNARDALAHGGIISLVTGRAQVNQKFIREYGFGVPGEYAVICLTDNGSGMDQKTADKIFEPFFTTKEYGQGTGLGLAIVYNIIKSHKGNIICTSKPGEGTSFTIYLPRLSGDDRAAVADTEVPVQKGAELILLAEDETEVRELMQHFLEKYGYQVIAVENGEDAVAEFMELREEVDLVVLDAGLPRLSGPDALARMRQQQPNLKGIIVSGYAEDTYVTEETGQITRFLAKPIGPAELARAVREELDR